MANAVTSTLTYDITRKQGPGIDAVFKQHQVTYDTGGSNLDVEAAPGAGYYIALLSIVNGVSANAAHLIKYGATPTNYASFAQAANNQPMSDFNLTTTPIICILPENEKLVYACSQAWTNSLGIIWVAKLSEKAVEQLLSRSFL